MASDDESSDSSNEFLVSAEKIDLNDTFFNNGPSTSATKSAQFFQSSSESSDDDNLIAQDAEDVDPNALLAEVMRNLEQANALIAKSNETQVSKASVASSTPSVQKKGQKRSKKTSNDAKNDSKPPAASDLSSEINDLLLKGESGLGSSIQFADSDDHGDEIKEEQPSDYSIPKEGVNITLPGTGILLNRRKKRGVDLQAELIRRMNQRLRLNQLLIHKVGLLCWLAHGFHLNRTINDPEIMALVLSLIPPKICPDGRADIKYVEGFTNWFKKTIKVEFSKDDIPVTKEILVDRLNVQKAKNYRELVLLFIAALRAIGINCRLVLSLCAPPMKLKRSQLFQAKKVKDDADNDKAGTDKKPDIDKKDVDKEKKPKIKRGRAVKKKKEDDVQEVPLNTKKADDIAKEDAKKRAVEILRSKFATVDNKKKLTRDVKVENEADDEAEEKSTPRTTRLRSRAQAKQEEELKQVVKKSKPGPKSSKIAQKSTTSAQNKGTEVKGQKGQKSNATNNDDDDDDDDHHETKEFKSESELSLEEESSSEDSDVENFKRKRKVAAARRRKASESSKQKKERNLRKVLSSDDETVDEKIDVRDARYLWVEVYVESEESWISVSVPDNKVHCVSEIYKKAPTPVLYVIAWNSSGSIKDVTRRYCPHWLTVTRKQRVDEQWWCGTMSPWKEKRTAMSKAEDEMLLQMEMEQPLPDTVGKYKGHPLYVLARHLLKYESLYPRDCVPLHHLKNGEAVYSRHCVHTLRSRETWLKEARVVKLKQEPYKVVKSMPKLDRFTGQYVKDLPLELFGKWQTMPYDPPEAKNGKVPRNEYGNVDLFKQCMLPKGTVHIDLPGLGRIAKKLNIDCAGAVVGFNFGCRGAMPLQEGFVVCEEYESTLREAWESEQIMAAKRAKEKREKTIWGNWRKLIRGLLIREKIAARYNMKDDDDDNHDKDASDNDKSKSKEATKPVSPGKRSKTDKKPAKKRKV